jgi:tetratricopeptide (TPR) repeat protein
VRLAAAALVLGAVLLYLPSVSNPYLRYDDDLYVTGNGAVREGLNLRGAAWAATTFHASNWHPLTWLSHMADVSLFGLSPAGPHAENALLHGTTAALLFLALLSLTGAPGRSLLVAALFAAHPLQVETVSWIAERKSLLSALFFVAALWGYGRYVRAPSPGRYGIVALLFALSLLAKPMAVTFPFLLLLLDFWPLGRLGGGAPAPAGRGDGDGEGVEEGRRGGGGADGWRRVAAEKAPLLALSALSSAATVAAQRAGGSLVRQEGLPMWDRAGNGAISYAAYVAKAAWPDPLAAFYPFRQPVPWGSAALCAIALAAVSAAAFAFRRRAPWFLTGWFWFAGVLFPVSGLVQAGSQAMADRYAYLPAVGLFVIVAWGGRELLARAGAAEGRLPALLGGAAVAACALVTFPQQLHWRSDEALFAHAAEAVPRNGFAEMNLGVALNRGGRPAEAEGHLRKALEWKPDYRDARYNLAVVLDRLGRGGEAEGEYRLLLSRWPRHAPSLNNLAFLLASRGETGEAVSLYRRALEAQPRFTRARVNLGAALSGQGRTDEAIALLDEALREAPGDPAARYQAAQAWRRKGRPEEAARHLRELLRIVPGNEAVRKELAEVEGEARRKGGR